MADLALLLRGTSKPVEKQANLCALLKDQPREDNGRFAGGGTRPDGAPIKDSPPKGSKAESRGIKVGGKVSYAYTDMYGTAFRGAGTATGFVHNVKGGSPHGDVAIHDTQRGTVVFVDSKNVRVVGKADLGDLIKRVVDSTIYSQAATYPYNGKKQPTDKHKKAGNYPKGHITVSGIPISIENPAYSKRRPEWPELKSHYGYIKRTLGADGDQVDVFVKVGTDDTFYGPIFIVNQHKASTSTEQGAFDEHKVMIGWTNAREAKQGYLDNYSHGWSGLGSMAELTVGQFKQWLKNGDTKQPYVKKSFSAPSSGTTGLGGYSIEGKPTKKKKRAKLAITAQDGVQQNQKADLGHLIKKAPKKRVIAAHTWQFVQRQDSKLANSIKTALKRGGKKLAAEIGKKIKLTPKKVSLLGLLRKAQPTDKEIEDILNAVDIDGFAVAVTEDIGDALEEAFREAALSALEAAGIENTEAIVDHVDERAVAYAQERGAEMVGKKWVDGELVDNPNAEWSIGETTRDNLRSLIEGAVVDGDSTTELMDAILTMGDFDEARAEMIARTELAFAHVQGNLEGWRASGVVEKKQWIVGEGCCDECAVLDQEIVDLDETFSSGDEGPPAHPNCRCDVVAYVEGEKEGEPIPIEEGGDGE